MAITAVGDRGCIEPFAGSRDITELGHCNFQFYDNAAGHHFSPAALLVCPPVASEFLRSTGPVRFCCSSLAAFHLRGRCAEADEDIGDEPHGKIGPLEGGI